MNEMLGYHNPFELSLYLQVFIFIVYVFILSNIVIIPVRYQNLLNAKLKTLLGIVT